MADLQNCFIDLDRLMGSRDAVLARAPGGEQDRWAAAFDKLSAEIRARPSLEEQLSRYHELCTGPAEVFDADLISMWGYCLAFLGLDLPARLPGF